MFGHGNGSSTKKAKSLILKTASNVILRNPVWGKLQPWTSYVGSKREVQYFNSPGSDCELELIRGGHPGCNSEECVKSIVEKDHREI